jgi:hypothetical protein
MRRLSFVIAIALVLAGPSASIAYAGGGPPAKRPPPSAARPGQTFSLSIGESSATTQAASMGTASGECWGFSTGGPLANSSVWGQAYQSCWGVGIVLQQQVVDVMWCVSTPFGLCLPKVNMGTVTTAETYGAGGFWTPSGTRAVTGGRSYMIETTHKVFWLGGMGEGTSSSAIFYVSG